MAKYYLLLFAIVGMVFFYIFLQDPCNQLFRKDFLEKFPDYEILDTSSSDGSPGSVQCHVLFEKPDSDQIFEEAWLYENSDSGWSFSGFAEEGRNSPEP